MSNQNLRLPGPVPMPDPVREALSRQMINHRGSEFNALFARVRERLGVMLGSSSEILCFTSSGSGGLEAAVVNLFSPADTGLFVVGGVFGERAVTIAKAFGVNVVRVDHAWGTAADPEALRAALRAHPDVKVVYLTHNETSTGITNPIEQLAEVVHAESNALIFVDSVSGAGALPFEVDAWGIDVVVTASQKGFACPPGLSMVSVSPKAWQQVEQATLPRFYWDFRSMRKAHNEGSTPFTPAISTFYALDVALELMEQEGREAVFARHARAGAMVRQQCLDLGLSLFAQAPYQSNCVTAVQFPDSLDASVIRNELRINYNTIVGGGLGPYQRSTLRIGHLGFFTEAELTETTQQLGAVITRLGGS
jgi:predicted phosphoserine aminotransferase